MAFFIDDEFYSDIERYIRQTFNDSEDEINALDDNWVVEAELGELQPMFSLDADSLSEILASNFEDRTSEDGEEFDDLESVLKECIDFEKLNSKIPKLYYASGKMERLTKQDLLDSL